MMHRAAFFYRSLALFPMLILIVATAAVQGVESTLAYVGTDGRLAYGTYANENETNADNRLPDFSYCGYMGGGVTIPNVATAVTVWPIDGDDTQNIQNAINAVSALSPNASGFRGAVLLMAGRYQVASTLHINTGGVVLRGEGQDILGTVLEAVTPSDYDAISIGSGSAGYGAQSGTTRTITSPFVGTGSVSFNVSDASGYAVGNWISVRRTPNQFWIDDLTMGQWGWTPDGYVTDHERYVMAVSGNTITVDVPLVDVYQEKYGGGQIFKLNAISRISKSGVENLRLESCYASATDEVHPWDAIRVQYAENCWVRGVTAQYFAYSCANLGSYARYITVEDCAFIDPKSVITGGRRYSFNIDGTATRNLFQRCYSHESRHDFVLGSKTRGPNAFVDCYADRSHADAGPHHRWSTGCLFDNVYSSNSIDVENREASGTGHGWSGAQMVFWNCQTPSEVCDAPKGAMNFAIGSKATKREGHWATEEPFGWWEHQNLDVSPRSLYFQQLKDRLGQSAVDNVTTPSQRAGNIWSQILAWGGKARFQPNPLGDNTPKDRPLTVGKPLIFEVLPGAGATILKYEWYEIISASYIPIGQNSPLLVLPAAQEIDSGRAFFCRIITDQGPYWSPVARVISIAGGTHGQPVEDFESRTAGVTIDNLNAIGALGGVWDTEGDSTGNVTAQSVDGSMTLSVSGHSSGTLNRGGGITDLTNKIENTETGVVFFRFKVGAAAKPLRNYLGMHHYTGSGFLTGSTCQPSAVTAGFGVSADASGGLFDIVTTDHAVTLKAGLVRGQWYNAWIVADNAADTFDVYVNTAAGPGIAVESPLDSDRITPAGGCAFGVGTTSPLAGAMFLVPRAPGDVPLDVMWIDDIYWGGDQGLTGVDDMLPAAPGNLTATEAEGTILLDWDDNPEPDFLQYVVYRSTTPGTGFTRLAEGLTDSHYTDNEGMDGLTRYYYVVRAENTDGHLSIFSDEVSGVSTIPLQIPTGLRASGADGSVHLLWDADTQPDFAFFTLYRSRWADTGFVPIAEGLTVNEYLDEMVENEKAYYYALTATNDEGTESVFCVPVAAVPHLPENLALNKPATASSYYGTAVPSYAVDGAVSDYPYIWHSAQDGSDPQPWIRVDLLDTYSVDKVRIYNRASAGTYSRNRDFDLDVLDSTGALVWSNYDETTGEGELINEGNWMNSPAMIEYVLPPSVSGRYIVLTKRSGLAGASATANIAEFEVYRRFEAPAAVTALTAEAFGGHVLLNWEDNSVPPDSGYRIYRRTEQTGYVQISQTIADQFEDPAAAYGVTCYYVVTAIDAEGIESGYCGEASIKLALSADLDLSGSVDVTDFSLLSQQWQSDGSAAPSADIAPDGGDGQVNMADLMLLAEQWLQTN